MEPGGIFDILAGGLQGILLVYFFIRLQIKVYARLTSWGMYLILVLGYFFVALPRSYQVNFLTDLQPLIRLIIFTLSAIFCLVDLITYLRMTKEKREELKK